MSRRTKKLQDIRAAKDRRAKKLAIGGAVLLVAILAFELPHYLGGSKSSPTAGATTPSTTPVSTVPGGTATPVATAPGTAAAASMPVSGSTKLPNSDVPPGRTKSQLYSFATFAGKDPFVQQVSTAQATSPASSGSSSSPAPSAASTSAPTSSAPAQTASTASVQQSSARTLAAGGAATISVNGKTETVRVGESFPSGNPVFRLVSLAHGSANVGIANGSYASGAQTVRLSSGRPLTLVDTADGIRYTVRLIAG